MTRARVVAFYLPQFHPIPENDGWWGRGFTEWTNVTKATPLYPGHVQPRLPADLGFYDLRVPEVREAQATLARDHGVAAFCYWHYWFGSGRRILERPFAEVLASGKPDFPFCLAWANDSWTGVWHGAPDRVLIEQTYPGRADHEDHFASLLPAFRDPRYLRVDGKPVFVVFRPRSLPDAREFTELWRDLALRAGLAGIYLVGMFHMKESSLTWGPPFDAFDAVTSCPPVDLAQRVDALRPVDLRSRVMRRLARAFRARRPTVLSYEVAAEHSIPTFHPRERFLPCVMPGWDNTPRSGMRGLVLEGATPRKFGELVEKALAFVEHHEPEERIVFIKAWNEWAEGNYLEPDRLVGTDYLRALAAAVQPVRRR